MLSQPAIPNIVLLKNGHASTHAIRHAIRRAGLTTVLDTISDQAQMAVTLGRCRADLVLIGADGFDGSSITEVLKSLSLMGLQIPVIVVGADAESERSQAWKESISDYVRVSQLDRLPAVLDRVLRDHRHRSVSACLQSELDRAAEILRENQKMITIGRLTASIAHEINNPLESIANLLYLLQVDRGSEKWEEYLQQAQKELNRVISISKQTLTFSREMNSPASVQLSDLVEEVLGLYSRKIQEKNLGIMREFLSSDLVIVFPGEMRQVLSNLIANAIEASHDGGSLRLRIRTGRNWSDQGVRGVRLSIADDGVGMTAEVRSRLGEPFFTTKGQNGTGLGLWVTRSILNRYGGNLALRSSVSHSRHGTVFSMFLPTNMRPQAVQPSPGQPSPVRASVPSTAAGDDHSDSLKGGGFLSGSPRRFGVV